MVIFDVSDRHGAVCLSVSVTCAVVPCALSPLCPCIPEAVDAFFFIIIIILSFFIFPFWLFCWFFFLFCFGLVFVLVSSLLFSLCAPHCMPLRRGAPAALGQLSQQ